jgi:hypothetical protein
MCVNLVAIRARDKYWIQHTKIYELTAVTGRELPIDASSTIGVDIVAAATSLGQEGTRCCKERREKSILVGSLR